MFVWFVNFKNLYFLFEILVLFQILEQFVNAIYKSSSIKRYCTISKTDLQIERELQNVRKWAVSKVIV